jgi:predicted ATPase
MFTMTKEQVIVDIKVPNQSRYLSLIGTTGEEIACILERLRETGSFWRIS